MSESSGKSGTPPNVVGRRSRSSDKGWRRALGSAGVFVVGGLLALHLSGVLLLWSLMGDARSASPLTLPRYWYYFRDEPQVTTKAKRSLAASFLMVSVAGGALLWPRVRPLHGTARFARRAEIRAAGLLARQGILLGRWGAGYLMLGGQQGVALAAPPRAGKGAGIVIPNALNWSGSLVCVDIKRENWTVTAGYRAAHGQACFLFDPLAEDGRTAHWNPLSYVSMLPARRINDLQRIADMLYPEAPGTDPFWVSSARSLFLGITLYLFETPTLPRTLGEVLRQGMASGEEGFGEHWKRLVEGRRRGAHPLSEQCVRALYDVIDLAPVTASSIRKTFTSRLELWQNPILDAATSSDDFDLRALRSKLISIYVAVNPDDLHRLRPLISLFFQQAIGLQTRELPEHNPALRHQVLMLLDECAALGRIPIIAESISYLPGYNVRVLLVIQSPAQLREVYGPNNAETMLKSLAARIVFAPKDVPDAREISEELGYSTVRSKSRSRPRWGLAGGSRKGGSTGSVTESDQRRALLLPQEVKEIGSDQAIVFYEGLRPILCRKVRYFEDPLFKARLLPPPDVVAKTGPAMSPREPVAAHPQGTSAEQDQSTEGNGASASVRTATAADVERIDELELDDFALDTTIIEIPPDRGLTDTELHSAVDQFMASLGA
ncbi:MAG: type IV secretory system conjugative DNA transfer family protein [Pseudomonadota bacterium]